MPNDDPFHALIERAYGQWAEHHARGEAADVLIEGVVDGLTVEVTAAARTHSDGGLGCAMTARRERMVAGVIPLDESTNAWVGDAPDALALAVADLRFGEDDRDLIEFALEDEEDPDTVAALQGYLDALDEGNLTAAVQAAYDPSAPAELEELAQGLARAILAGVEASGIERPFVVDHRPGGVGPHLPGFVRVGSAAFRDSVRDAVAEDGAAVELLFEGDPDTEVATFEVADFCPPEIRRLAAEVSEGRVPSGDAFVPDPTGAAKFADDLADRVVHQLNQPGAVPGVADAFLMLSRAGAPYRQDDLEAALRRAARMIGAGPVDAFRASIASRQATADAPPVSAQRQDRAVLTQALAARGIPNAEEIVRVHASPALRLVAAPDEESLPAAILHGRGLLPPGEPWPHSERGRALAFLAAIDCAQLRPELDGAPALPTAGWMLFFADIDDPTGYDPARWNEPQPTPGGWAQGEFYGEPTENVAGANARMLWVPPGIEPVVADPPGLRGTHALAEDRRVAVEQLTLPDDYDVGARLGLSAAHANGYGEVAGSLRYEAGGDGWHDDWVLGAATGVQGYESEADTVLLLHLASVEFQDGGAIQFRIPAGALAKQDWTQVVAQGDSN